MHQLLFLAAILAPALCARLPYIVGGSDVKSPGQYPWQASLQMVYEGGWSYHICGASLISARWLVTASHCVEGSTPSSLKIVLGMHDKDSLNYGLPEDYRIQGIRVHEDYRYEPNSGFPNDIALIYIASDANTNSQFISTIELPSLNEDFSGNPECYITGWGALYGGGPSPDVLQEAHVDVYTPEHCRGVLGSTLYGKHHVCLSKHAQSTSCNGDSGGPLACRVEGVWKLVGATSWGFIGCPTNYPAVYANVAYFRDWIYYRTGL